jgi:hypothetical protein
MCSCAHRSGRPLIVIDRPVFELETAVWHTRVYVYTPLVHVSPEASVLVEMCQSACYSERAREELHNAEKMLLNTSRLAVTGNPPLFRGATPHCCLNSPAA